MGGGVLPKELIPGGRGVLPELNSARPLHDGRPASWHAHQPALRRSASVVIAWHLFAARYSSSLLSRRKDVGRQCRCGSKLRRNLRGKHGHHWGVVFAGKGP